MISAATPATWGEDIDVPEADRLSVPVPAKAETILEPGAVISGLKITGELATRISAVERPQPGPRLLKLEI